MRAIILFPIVLFLSQESVGQILHVPAGHATSQGAIDSATGTPLLGSRFAEFMEQVLSSPSSRTAQQHLFRHSKRKGTTKGASDGYETTWNE